MAKVAGLRIARSWCMASFKVLRTCVGTLNRIEDEDENEEEDEKRFMENSTTINTDEHG
jgi:hypothetical protein